jgi:SAM-dependent methyltransferase
VGYQAASTYAELIAPRYAPIADALVEAAALGEHDDVLELGAGTGLVTARAAPRVRSLVSTDLSERMLALARDSIPRLPGLTFALVDYGKRLPFLDGSFDVVLSGLTYVQDAREPLREIVRVLRPGGRLAIAMWGNAYHELRLLSDAFEAIGLARIPPPAPGRAMRRLGHAGFGSITREELRLVNRFESVDTYIAYRRGFGIPVDWTRATHERFLRVLRREASRDADGGGTFELGWTLAIITAARG